MAHWTTSTVFYHIYPLGLSGAPEHNDFCSEPIHRLDSLMPWLDHAASMGCNGLYLGPLFESGTHGYDTADYYNVDRRLGDRQTLKRFVAHAHQLGIKVILDGVFNHVGRGFWAFRDVLANRQNSAWCSWFKGLRFDSNNAYNDGFCYDTWDGHQSLVKLNLSNPDVCGHLLGAVKHWIEDYDIDGLRLDAADVVDKTFLSSLAAYSRSLKPEFWLMGEVVHGDYRHWANPERLDSVTNYECYKGLYSSLNDLNFFEIAWSLNRQFGAGGMYKDINLYAFADNHDVNRVASMLKNPAHLPLLYTLLMTMPGVPSIYYGSEFGIQGKKNGSDKDIRPMLDLGQLSASSDGNEILKTVKKLIAIRRDQLALQSGEYQQVLLTNEQFAFSRTFENKPVITVLNAASKPNTLKISMPGYSNWRFMDVLDQAGITYQVQGETLNIECRPETSMILVPG